jgi:Sec-independent protein translocase protein TatA
LTLAFAIVVSLSLLLLSNSRLTGLRTMLQGSIGESKETLRESKETLRAEAKSQHTEVLARLAAIDAFLHEAVMGKLGRAGPPPQHPGEQTLMNQFPQWGPTAVMVGGYIVGLYFQTREIESLRNEINAKFEAMNARFEIVNAKFEAAKEALFRVEGVLDARLKHLEDRER